MQPRGALPRMPMQPRGALPRMPCLVLRGEHDLSKLVFDDCNLAFALNPQQVVQHGGLTRPQEASQHSDGHLIDAHVDRVSTGTALVPSDGHLPCLAVTRHLRSCSILAQLRALSFMPMPMPMPMPVPMDSWFPLGDVFHICHHVNCVSCTPRVADAAVQRDRLFSSKVEQNIDTDLRGKEHVGIITASRDLSTLHCVFSRKVSSITATSSCTRMLAHAVTWV